MADGQRAGGCAWRWKVWKFGWRLSTLTINVKDNSDSPTYPSAVTYAELQVDLFNGVTLRDALNAANNSGNGNTYVINLQTNTTYNLTNIDNNTSGSNGLPLISSTTTIVGNGSTIERTGSNAFRLFDVASDGSLTLENMTLTGGLRRDRASRRMAVRSLVRDRWN